MLLKERSTIASPSFSISVLASVGTSRYVFDDKPSTSNPLALISPVTNTRSNVVKITPALVPYSILLIASPGNN